MFYTCFYESPIGKMLLASTETELVGLWFENQKYYLESLKGKIKEAQTLVLVQTRDWLDRYFRGEKPEISELPLAPIGGEFRQAVWKMLCEIPYGKTVTYGYLARELAKRSGKKSMSAQAVGGAVGHNPISVVIPCHRVLGANGDLTGYAGGLEIKKCLLTLEGAAFSETRRV